MLLFLKKLESPISRVTLISKCFVNFCPIIICTTRCSVSIIRELLSGLNRMTAVADDGLLCFVIDTISLLRKNAKIL